MIGPCICWSCFEVGEEVAALFPDDFVSRDYGTKPHVDLPGYVRSQLVAHGVPASAIQDPIDCTRCNPHQYFSRAASASTQDAPSLASSAAKP